MTTRFWLGRSRLLETASFPAVLNALARASTNAASDGGPKTDMPVIAGPCDVCFPAISSTEMSVICKAAKMYRVRPYDSGSLIYDVRNTDFPLNLARECLKAGI